MEFHGSKFNIIILVSLCIVNIMKTECAKFMLQMTIDESGQMTVHFEGMNFTLHDDFTLTIQDNDCEKTVSLQPPTQDELVAGEGYRPGSWLCKSWFTRDRDIHLEIDELRK
ncbi:unnamed protein product [Trichobilharzia szidati]|nr:unnamed protein product [Trichobilharzia szidati]